VQEEILAKKPDEKLTVYVVWFEMLSMLTGQRLSPAWGREKADRHLKTSTAQALKGYYRMWPRRISPRRSARRGSEPRSS